MELFHVLLITLFVSVTIIHGQNYEHADEKKSNAQPMPVVDYDYDENDYVYPPGTYDQSSLDPADHKSEDYHVLYSGPDYYGSPAIPEDHEELISIILDSLSKGSSYKKNPVAYAQQPPSSYGDVEVPYSTPEPPAYPESAPPAAYKYSAPQPLRSKSKSAIPVIYIISSPVYQAFVPDEPQPSYYGPAQPSYYGPAQPSYYGPAQPSYYGPAMYSVSPASLPPYQENMSPVVYQVPPPPPASYPENVAPVMYSAPPPPLPSYQENAGPVMYSAPPPPPPSYQQNADPAMYSAPPSPPSSYQENASPAAQEALPPSSPSYQESGTPAPSQPSAY